MLQFKLGMLQFKLGMLQFKFGMLQFKLGMHMLCVWMSVSCECCVLSGRGLCDGLIPRPEEFYRVWCVWMWSWSLEKWGGLGPQGAVEPLRKHAMRNFRLTPWCKSDLRSSGMLRGVDWQLPTFRGNLSVPSSRAKQFMCWTAWPLNMIPVGCPETSVTNYQSALPNIQAISQRTRCFCSPVLTSCI
jgi:hypothetical protein